MKFGYSLWIENTKDEKVFGEGPYRLLLLVDELGSLNKASAKMKMSYSKTINIINKCESALNIKLLEREIGGIDGGGSILTKEARKLISDYEKFKEISQKSIAKYFNEIFNN